MCLDRTCTLVLSAHFIVCPIGRSSNITRPKSRAPRKKFVHPCLEVGFGLMGGDIFDLSGDLVAVEVVVGDLEYMKRRCEAGLGLFEWYFLWRLSLM